MCVWGGVAEKLYVTVRSSSMKTFPFVTGRGIYFCHSFSHLLQQPPTPLPLKKMLFVKGGGEHDHSTEGDSSACIPGIFNMLTLLTYLFQEPKVGESGVNPRISFSLEGSRVSQELRYTKEKLGEEALYTSQMLIQTPRQEGENILNPEALGMHLEAAMAASKVQVLLYGK